jgi:hypothetical protein
MPENYSEIVLGERVLALDSEEVVQIKIYDSLGEAVDNYKVNP